MTNLPVYLMYVHDVFLYLLHTNNKVVLRPNGHYVTVSLASAYPLSFVLGGSKALCVPAVMILLEFILSGGFVSSELA